jgi:hypothetical protein
LSPRRPLRGPSRHPSTGPPPRVTATPIGWRTPSVPNAPLPRPATASTARPFSPAAPHPPPPNPTPSTPPSGSATACGTLEWYKDRTNVRRGVCL